MIEKQFEGSITRNYKLSNHQFHVETRKLLGEKIAVYISGLQDIWHMA